MDPDFIARLERRALAKHGLPPPSWTDDDISMYPPPISPQSNTIGHPPDDDDSQSEDDDDEVLRAIGEVPPEADDQHPSDPMAHAQRRSASLKELEHHSAPNEEVEEEDDDGTTDSEEENRPKKPEAMPTIRLTLTLPTQLPLNTIEQSVSLLARQAGYHLPADTAITFGASSVPEPELPPQHSSTDVPSLDMPPPPKRRRRRRIQERDEGYDKDDPFVDDSEAFIMEPKYYYPPARDGFFAATGRLELKSDLKKSKPRKPALKNLPAGPTKPKRRAQLTTVPESSTASIKPPAPSTSHSKDPVQPTQPKGASINHQLVVPSSPNPAQQIQSTDSIVDPQVLSQSPNLVKQTHPPDSHPHHPTSDPLKNPVQQAQSKSVHTDPQLTSKPPIPISQTQNKGPIKNPQTISQVQHPNPVPSTQSNGSTTTHAQTSASQHLANYSLAQGPTKTHQIISQSQIPEQHSLAKAPITNHQANSQLSNLTQYPQAKLSDTIQKIAYQSSNPVQQTQPQGSNADHQVSFQCLLSPVKRARFEAPNTTLSVSSLAQESALQAQAAPQPTQAQALESNIQLSKLPLKSTPTPIAHETPSAKTAPMPQPLAASQAAPSHASAQGSVAPLHGFGTPLNPISLIDDEDPTTSARPSVPHSNQVVPADSSPGPSDQISQRPRPPYLKSRSFPERKTAGPLPPMLEQALEQLKVKIEAASPFVPKKFPPELKPFTLEVAEMALDLNEYDECFFVRLAELFPYNTFTIKKFVKREILPRRKQYYEGQINQRIQRLTEMITEEMPSARKEYEQAMEQYRQVMLDYEKRQEARQNLTEPSTALPANASTILGDTITKSPFTTLVQNSTEVQEKPPKAPTKLFKLTEPMRQIIYELVKLEDEHSETVKDTQKIVDKNVTFKDTSNRRQFYARLAHLWPDDFMSTARLSHIVSSIKKRMEGNPVVESITLS